MPTSHLLSLLLHATGPTSITELSRHAHATTAQLLATLDTLRAAGCVIDTHPQQGVRLAVAGLSCWADYLASRHAGRLGHAVTVYRQIASTQDAARQLLDTRPDATGHVVIADHQTGGRGRLGRRWLAPPASSLLLTAIVDARGMTADRLMLATCCALALTVESAGPTAQVRWPNDILIDGRKVAGTLVETFGDAALIGVGLNVTTREMDLPPGVAATSLALHGVHRDRLLILDTLLDRLDTALDHTDDAALLDAWRARSCLTQQRITVESDGRAFTGRVLDIDPAHGLILSDDAGAIHTLPAATTSLVGG